MSERFEDNYTERTSLEEHVEFQKGKKIRKKKERGGMERRKEGRKEGREGERRERGRTREIRFSTVSVT